MVQSGFALELQRNYEDYASLKKYMKQYNRKVDHIRHFSQVTANAAANLEELSGETLTAMAASKVLNVWQKTDQVGTDGAEKGVVQWQDVDGALTEAVFQLNAVNTTTHVALDAAVSTARHVRSFCLDGIVCADELLLGNVAGTEIFGVIKVGYHQTLKSKFMCEKDRNTWLAKLRVHLSAVSAAVTLVCTFTPLGGALAVTKTFITKTADAEWEPCIELEPGSEVSWTIEDDNAAHPTAEVEIIYLEGYFE